jgi:hypothetical protein
MLSASRWSCNELFAPTVATKTVVLAAQVHHASGTASDIMLK